MLLGIDVGTTNVRSCVFSEKGEVVGSAIREVTVQRPKPGWAEEDPEDLWRGTIETMRDAVHASNVSPNDIDAISFSAQMHGVSMIDREGKVLVKLITWLDLRSGSVTEKMSDYIDVYELYSRTGCPLIFIYPFSKVLWIRENMPEVFKRCHKILSAKDYVVYKMLGKAYTDHSIAAGSQMMNIHKLKWDEKVLEVAGISEDELPTLYSGTEVVGELPRSVAEFTGLRRGTPIVLGASDGALSGVGLGALEGGIASLNIGTSGALRLVSERPVIDRSREMRLWCYYIAQERWLLGAGISNAGVLLRWFRDNFGDREIEIAKKRGIDPYDVMTEEAATVKLGANNLIVSPFFAGERFPVGNPNARGIMFGLTLAHGRAHIIRAIMESTAFMLRWIMEVIEEQGLEVEKGRLGGGGSRSQLWRQIVADTLGRPIIHTKVEEASALGAAMLGAIAVGTYKDMRHSAENMVKDLEVHMPDMDAHRTYSRFYEKFKEIYLSNRSLVEEVIKL